MEEGKQPRESVCDLAYGRTGKDARSAAMVCYISRTTRAETVTPPLLLTCRPHQLANIHLREIQGRFTVIARCCWDFNMLNLEALDLGYREDLAGREGWSKDRQAEGKQQEHIGSVPQCTSSHRMEERDERWDCECVTPS